MFNRYILFRDLKIQKKKSENSKNSHLAGKNAVEDRLANLICSSEEEGIGKCIAFGPVKVAGMEDAATLNESPTRLTAALAGSGLLPVTASRRI